ncbi:MAG: non-hydrolyzing UDP-N-acetylglucosamine 2-epimerase [Candidatus Tectimicrobiota bacterium]
MNRQKVLAVFGTRPETIKLAPVIQALNTQHPALQAVTVLSGQHHELLHPFVSHFGLKVHYDLAVMAPQQTPTQVCTRILQRLEPVLQQEQPALLLVQGDTTTALAGALAAFYQRVPVGHVEAGLRTTDAYNPYPEEIHRRLITRLASYHFAATTLNRDTLRHEGVPEERIFVTGNPVVDTVRGILRAGQPSAAMQQLLDATQGLKRLVLTTHRRESFGATLAGNLHVLRRFVAQHDDVCLLFPVHPNPQVRGPASAILGGQARISLLEPLEYADFIRLLAAAWLIVSDSGGVQEEAPSLGRPVLVIRETTERQEAIDSGVARLVSGGPAHLEQLLVATYRDGGWLQHVREVPNPFGQGDSGARIANIIACLLRKGGPDVSPQPAGCGPRMSSP